MRARNSTGGIYQCWQRATWCLWDWWNCSRVSPLLHHLDTSVEEGTSRTGVSSCRHLWFSGEVVAGVTYKSLHLKCPELQKEDPAEMCNGSKVHCCFCIESHVRLLPVVGRVPVHHKNGPSWPVPCSCGAYNSVSLTAEFRRALVCRRGAQCSLWSVTPCMDSVTLQ